MSAAAALTASVALALTGHPVGADCQLGHGTIQGAADMQRQTISFTTETCRLIRRGHGVGIWAVLHETGHLVGGPDEHQADCYAQDHFLMAARRWWHLKPKAARAALRDALAWRRSNNDSGYGCVR